ncbi:MAG: carboxypeptidase regulatory-like domain-containing protein [Candidatus Desantisbacteria bacterium]
MKKIAYLLLCILMFIPTGIHAESRIKNAIPSDAGDNNPTSFRFMPDNIDKQLSSKENAPLSSLEVNDGSINIFVDGQNLCLDSTPAETRKKLVGMDLSNAAGWPDIKITPGNIGVDPELGRFKLADGDMEISKLIGKYDALHTAYGVFVQDKYAYIANFQQGLEIIDISNPKSPVPTGRHDTDGWAYEVFVSGKYAFVADGYAGLQIIDISAPKNPILLGTCDTPGWAYDVQVVGKYAFVADYRGGLQIIDVSNPLKPFIASSLEIIGAQCRGVYVSGNYAYIADDKSGMYIVNITDPIHPVLASTYNNTAQAKGVFVSNNYAYLVNYQSLLEVIDVSNPKNPVLKARLSLPGNLYDIVGFDKYAYIAANGQGIHIVDLTELTNPRLIDTYKTTGKAFNLHVANGYAFVADDYQGLEIVDVPYPSELPLGKITVDYYRSDLKASLTSPDGNEVWDIGNQQNIVWNISGGIPPYTVDISYARDGLYPINSNIVKGLKQQSMGPNVYIWTMPPVVSDRLGIMVSVVDSNGNKAMDISNGYFSLKSDTAVKGKNAPLLILLKGITGSQYLMGGAKLDIGWLISGGISPYTVDLYYSIDNGKTYSVMDSNLSQVSYPWILPQVDSQAIRVKAMVTDALGEKATAVSETFKLDATPPTVVYTNIPDEQTGIEPGTMPFVIQFSERMDVNQQDIFGITPFASHTVSWNDTGNIFTITPNISLPDATYTLSLHITARDVVGNNLAQKCSWSFKTAKEDEIANVKVTSTANFGLEITGDYKYTSNHGDIVSLNAEILNKDGIPLEHFVLSPFLLKKGKGSFSVEAFYTGSQSLISESMKLVMLGDGKPFYTKHNPYAKKWASPLTIAIKTDKTTYYQGDYVTLSLVVNTLNLPLSLRELSFDERIGDLRIKDGSGNVIFQWSRQNLAGGKSVSLSDNGAKILLQSTWLADKTGEFVLDGWLNKSNIYPQIQCPGLKFEVQQPRLGIVSGKVTDIVTKQPVQNATVTIGGYSAITNRYGEYQLVDIEPGDYALSVQSKGYYPYAKQSIGVKRGQQGLSIPLTAQDDLQFSIVLDKEGFGVAESIVATAVLRCSGTRTMTVSRLSMESESLFLEIETPTHKIVRYIGPFSSGLPPVVTLKPGEQTSLKLSLSQIAFGNKLELVSGYKITSPGKYTLKTTYSSWGNQPKRWIGKYEANPVEFEIGTPTVKADNTVEASVPQSGTTNVATDVAIITPVTTSQLMDWEMQIVAQSGQITSTAILGMYAGASNGFDAEFDEPLPPASADTAYLQVYFPHQDWGMIFDKFSRDIRMFATDAVIGLEVKTSSSEAVTLSFIGIPNGYSVMLRNVDDGQLWDLRTVAKCSLQGRTLYRFELSLKASSVKNGTQTAKGSSHTYGKGWNLISIPVGSNQQSSSTFEGINTYYLYGYNLDKQGYEEATTITNGCAYWLGMLATATVTVEDSPMANEATIALKPGWNMIGCPFSFAPDWSMVMVQKDGVRKGLKEAVGAGWVMDILYGYTDGNYQLANGIKPWEGYWLAALVDCSLIVPNVAAGSITTNILQAAPVESGKWQVGLNVSAGRYRDTANLAPCFGVNPNASPGLDANDRPESPEPQGSFVTLYFTHPEEGVFNRFDWDMKPLGSTTAWEFEVKTNLSNEVVAITWDKEYLPQGYCLLLIDTDSQTSMIMDKENGYTYTCPQDQGLSVRHFMVRAIKQETAGVQVEKVGDFKIWPNPAMKLPMHFDGFTGNLKILNLSGELIKDVPDVSAGYEWKLDNDAGETVASGLYIYMISDGNGNRRVGKVAVIR